MVCKRAGKNETDGRLIERVFAQEIVFPNLLVCWFAMENASLQDVACLLGILCDRILDTTLPF